MKVKYGIDFGTTNSSISIVEKNNLGAYVSKVLKISDVEPCYSMRSIVVLHSDGTLTVGDDEINDDDKVFNSFKPDVLQAEFPQDADEDDVLYETDICQVRYSDIIGALFAELFERVEPLGYSDKVDGVVLGLPNPDLGEDDSATKEIYRLAMAKSGFFGEYNDDSKEAIMKMVRDKVEFTQEPIALAEYYGQTRLGNERKTCVIVDYGGGTLDLALVRMADTSNPNGSGIMHRVIAKERSNDAGDRMSKELFFNGFIPEYSKKYLGGDYDLFWRDIRKTVNPHIKPKFSNEKKWEHLKEVKTGFEFVKQFDDFKRTLCSKELSEDKSKTEFSFESSDGEFSLEPISLGYDVFDKAIKELTEANIALIDKLLKDNKVSYRELDCILLAGGSSLVPSFRKKLKAAYKAYTNVNVTWLDDSVETMTATSQGLAYHGCEKDGTLASITNITDHTYSWYDDETRELNQVINKGTPFDSADISSPSLNIEKYKFKDTFKLANMASAKDVTVRVFEDDREVLTINFENSNFSGHGYLVFAIDSRQGELQVLVFDRKAGSFVKDLPIAKGSHKLLNNKNVNDEGLLF